MEYRDIFSPVLHPIRSYNLPDELLVENSCLSLEDWIRETIRDFHNLVKQEMKPNGFLGILEDVKSSIVNCKDKDTQLKIEAKVVFFGKEAEELFQSRQK